MDVLAVAEDELEDLRSRLRRTRWATSWPGTGWEAGTDGNELRRLVAYWADGFDWRKQEAALNALPSHFADFDGVPVHYLRYDGEQPSALPLVLTHGWPSSVLELTELAHRLASPTQYGRPVEEAFTVIVPSLPGFPFSPQRPSLPPATATHELWHRLMRDELGFARYGAHGGDLGAGISSLLGQAYPEEVVGIHLLAVANPAPVDPDELSPEEQAYLDAEAEWFAEEGGYEHEQMTRPLTLSAGLSDSPAGLLAWLLEKYRAWSDCDGEVNTRFSDDYILTQASLYWFTNSISTSFRPYYEFHRGLRERVTSVSVPTAIAVFPEDLVRPPRSWAARTYNVTRYTAMPRGGHFAAWEEPELLAEDLVAFFRSVLKKKT
ncbi:epoxide hydrolase family protein [Kribbella sp. CA-294648]|uniref:epoxide hydrolase family protein n=1 Tax=Kribbella sp. CA-294648 TaxID=3239948 RepID=UPI003D8D6F29